MHPLVVEILAVRAEIETLEVERPRHFRNLVMRRSLYLGGLEKAASLTLSPEDLVVLGDLAC